MYFDRDRFTEPNQFLSTLDTALNTIVGNYHQRQSALAQRGDDPKTLNIPSLLVTVVTDSREFTGRVFHVNTSTQFLDLYPSISLTPDDSETGPEFTLRMDAPAIIGVAVLSRVKNLPVEFAVTKAEFADAVEHFLSVVNTVTDDPTAEVIQVTDEQGDALRKAAEPVFSLIEASSIGYEWRQASSLIDRRHGVRGSDSYLLDTNDVRFNRLVVVGEPGRSNPPTPLSKFLTYGVPFDFLYSETHQKALDDYISHTEKRSGVTYRDPAE